MSTRALRFVSPAVILAAAALSAGGAAAGDPLPLPEGFVEIAEPASGAVDSIEKSTRAADEHTDRQPPHAKTAGSADAARTGEGPEAAIAVPDADAEAPPASRLLRSLDEWAAQPEAASPSPSPGNGLANDRQNTDEPQSRSGRGSSPGLAHSAAPGSFSVLHGCPRALLGSLLASAADADDAVSALAIERETLALCRERQEIVNGIVALEGELHVLLAEAQGEAGAPGTGAGTAGAADVPIVKVSVPVRVIEIPTPPPMHAEAADWEESATPPAPQPPVFSWFSIVGTADDLRAGVSGGAGNGGSSIWFVREGDRLPGGVTVTRIVARPPGVHVDGAVEAALPHRPRPADAGGPRENTPSGSDSAVGGDAAGAER